jgi:hypothetical protein
MDYLSGGYTSKPFTSPEYRKNISDPEAFLFSLTFNMQVYKAGNPFKALTH